MFDSDIYNEILNNKNIKNISKYINDDKNYSFENLKYFDYIKFNSKVNLNKKNLFNRNSLNYNNNNNNNFNNTTNFSINNISNNNNNNNIFKKTHISNKPKLINKNFNKFSLFNLKKNLINNSTNFSFKSKPNNNNNIKNFTFDNKIKNLTFDNKIKNFTFDSKDSTIPKISKTKTKKNEIRKKILILNDSENSEINNNLYTNQTLNLTTSNRNFSSKCDEIINDCKFHIKKINLKHNLNQIDPYQLRKLENKYKSIKYSNNKNEDVIFEKKNKKINLYIEDINEIRSDQNYYKKTLKNCLKMKKHYYGINNLDNKFAFKSKNFCKEIFGVEKSEIEKYKENENKIKIFRERNKKKIKEMNDLLEKNEKRYFKIHNMFDDIIKKQKIEKEKIEKFLKLRNNNN